MGLLFLPRVPEGSTITGFVVSSSILAALGFSRGGFSINHLDIAPGHAGVVIGMSNTAGTLAGIVGVSLTGHILKMYGGAASTEGWAVVCGISSCLCAAGAVLFMLFAEGAKLFD